MSETWVCDDEYNEGCACSTDAKVCRCVPEPVCSGPLVGDVIELEVECAECGDSMTAIDPATGVALAPQPQTFNPVRS